MVMQSSAFAQSTGPSLPTEYQVPSHVAEEVIRDVSAWIVAMRSLFEPRSVSFRPPKAGTVPLWQSEPTRALRERGNVLSAGHS
jgi:hypothetical protein